MVTARVVCLASSKGGAGKTLLTVTFSRFLAALGFRVLLIDTDAATNGLSLFFLKEVVKVLRVEAANKEYSALGLFEADASHPTHPTPVGVNLDLIPATYGFKNTESVPVDDYSVALKRAVAAGRDEYNFIFLDAQAGSDEYARVAASPGVSDEVIIVSEYDPMSAAGVERLKAILGESLGYFRTWILLNKMLPDFVKQFTDFFEIAKYASPIPWDAEVVRAFARRSLALDLDAGNTHTMAVLQTLRSLFGDVIGERLDEWLKSQAETLRKPVLAQVDDLKRELTETDATILKQRNFGRRRTMMKRSGAAIATIAAGLLSYLLASLVNVEGTGLFVAVFVPTLVAIFSFAVSGFLDAVEDYKLVGSLNTRRDVIIQRLARLEELAELSPEALVRKGGRQE